MPRVWGLVSILRLVISKGLEKPCGLRGLAVVALLLPCRLRWGYAGTTSTTNESPRGQDKIRRDNLQAPTCYASAAPAARARAPHLAPVCAVVVAVAQQLQHGL